MWFFSNHRHVIRSLYQFSSGMTIRVSLVKCISPGQLCAPFHPFSTKWYFCAYCAPQKYADRTTTTTTPQILYPDASAWHSHHNDGPNALLEEIAAAIRRSDTIPRDPSPSTSTNSHSTTTTHTTNANALAASTTTLCSTNESISSSSGFAGFSSPLVPLILVLKRKIRSLIVESR